ncbi:MAG: sodium/proton-translocating pyrophosphatase, partial [Eubacteriales bacterium]|nr:sodium/proton-translocating pyrophosphatase [Eubacteriales bacterium]
MNWSVVAILISALALAMAGWLYLWVKSRPSSNPEIARIGSLIRDGANAFLTREYKILAIFVSAVAVLILVFLPHPIWKGSASDNIMMAVSYICGSVLSALAGKIGIAVAT